MVFKIKNILIGGIVLVFVILSIFAINSYIARTGITTTVDEHGVCREITNNCDYDLFVPTATSGEWSNFRTYYPSFCCSCTNTCSECDDVSDCFSLYPSCSHLMNCGNGVCCDKTGPYDPDCPPACPS